MATHSSVLAWRIPWTEEPSGLWSIGSQRVGHTEATQQAHTHVYICTYGFPGDSTGQEFACNAGDEETQVQSLGQENLLEKEMATHFSILAWEIPWTEEPDGLQSMGSQRIRQSLTTKQQQN